MGTLVYPLRKLVKKQGRGYDSTIFENEATSKENAYPEDLIDNVRDAIERHPGIKIWTMSAGTTEECDTDAFPEYGMALDSIED